MYDTKDVIQNINDIYESNSAFQLLKDFERVLDELGLYVYANWEIGELADGPKIERHWVTCGFMWDEKDMPDPAGGKRLLDYDCKVRYVKSSIIEPRLIKGQEDIRTGTQKGKLDRRAVWVVEIQMPKKLMADMYSGYKATLDAETEPTATIDAAPEEQQADEVTSPEDAPGGETDADTGEVM